MRFFADCRGRAPADHALVTVGRALAALALAAGLAACGGNEPEREVTHASRRAPSYGDGAACIVDLSYRGVAFNRIKDTGGGSGCGIETAISLSQAPTPLNRPVEVDCALARQLSRWDVEVVQPAALRVFGQRLVMMEHYGGYACRGMSSNHARLSEHAKGDAIDVAAFDFADGSRVSVEHDWRAGGRKQEFLRQVAAAGCQLFSVVLTPDTDAYHYNHMHLDIGPWKDCSL